VGGMYRHVTGLEVDANGFNRQIALLTCLRGN